MKLIEINDQVYINPEHVLCVRSIPEKLTTIVVMTNQLIIESKWSYSDTVKMLNGDKA